MARRKIAIFGGSFDPITDGHLTVAASVMTTKVVDEVWITPCGARPDKPSLVTPALQRYMMCQLAVEDKFSGSTPIKCCDIEVFEKQSIPTFFCLQKLHEKYADCDFYWIIGTDLVKDLKSWDGGQELYDTTRWLIYPRPGYDLNDLPPLATVASYPDSLSHLSILTVEHSSTEMRKRLLTKDYSLCESLLPSPVISFIQRYNLYAPK